MGGTLRALVVMPLATQRGGAEVQLQQLIERRREARMELTVAFLESGPMLGWCRDRGVPAVALNAGRLRQPRKFGRSVRTILDVARDSRAEVVIGWMAKGQVYGGSAAALARLPGVWLQPGAAVGFVPIDRAATLLPARLVVTNSRSTDSIQRRLCPRRPTAVIYPAVDTARFDQDLTGDKRTARRRLGLPEDGPIFGSVGRLNSWKGFHVLLAAVPRILQRQPNATFLLVGGQHELEPSYAVDLAIQARRIDLEGRVRLVGQQPNPEEWIQAMDVFVHTSKNEPFGMVVIEAMALGKSVVATAEGGPIEIITPDVDGVLTPYGDSAALAAAVLRLLDDDELRSRIGQAAKRRAGDFTVQRFARQFGDAVATAAGHTDCG